MDYKELSNSIGSKLGAKNGIDIALRRYINLNKSYGSFSNGEFIEAPGFSEEKLLNGFREFSSEEYMRSYPSKSSGFDTYGDMIKEQYSGMMGTKVEHKAKMNARGVYAKHGDGVKFNGNQGSTTVDNIIKNNNRSVMNPEFHKGLKLNRSSSEHLAIKESMGKSKEMSAISFFDKKSVYNITENLANTVLMDGGKKSNAFTPVNEVSANASKEVVSRLHKGNFQEDLLTNLDNLVKNQTGSKFMKNVIKLNENNNIMTNKSSMQRNLLNFDDLQNGLKKLNNVLSNGGKFTVFDIEANSGINSYGHSVLGNITEVASITYDVANGIAKEGKVFNSVLGYTTDEYSKVLKALDNMKAMPKTKWSVEEKVLFDRMNIYDHSEMKTTDSFERQVIKAKGIDEINSTFEGAKRGAAKLRKIAESQESYLKAAGINKSYEQARTDYLQRFRNNLSNTLSVGHNVGMYDIPMLNRQTNSTKDIEIVDTLQTAWYSQSELGRQSIYAPGAVMPKGKGPATQEALIKAHGLENKNAAAHIAINDVRGNALLVTGQIGKPQVDKNGAITISNESYLNKIINPNMEKVKKSMSGTSSKYTGSDQLYYMDYTMQKSYNDMSGSMSLEYDPITKSFKSYDGTVIDRKTGEAHQAGYNGFGPKKNALYTHDIYEIDVNENFKKQFMNISGASEDQANKMFQEYSTAEKIYVTKSQEFMNLEELNKKVGSRELAQHYYDNRSTFLNIETNRSRVGANLGVHVADRKGNKIAPKEDALQALGFKKTSVKEGNVIVNEAAETSQELMNMILNKSMDRTINDSAARKIRELDYKKIVRHRNYQNKITKESGVTGMNPMATRIAEMVSKNKAIKLTDQEEIINALGWHDYKTGTNKVVKESINNALSMDSHIMQMSPLIDSITNMLDSTYGELDLSSPEAIRKISENRGAKETLLKKDIGFKQLYNDFLDKVINDPTIENMWGETIHTKAELNKIDFNMFDVNPDKYMKTLGGWSKNSASEVASLNLDNPNALINMFYNGRFKDLDGIVSKDGNAGYQSLTDAYKLIRADERFVNEDGKRIFDGINIKKYRNGNIAQLNDDMMAELRSFTSNARSQSSNWGYINPRMNQDILSSGELSKVINGLGKEKIDSILQELKPNLIKDLNIIGDDNRNNLVNKLVDDYFLTFKSSDLDLSGFTDQQKSYAKKQYDIARSTAVSKADSLLKSIEGTDIKLAMTNSNGSNVLNLIQGNQVAQLDDMFKFNHRKGIMTYQVGDNEYALKLGLGYKKDEGVFGFTNSVDKIASRRLDHMNAKWANDRGDSVVDAIVYNTRKTAGELRDASARIDLNNGQLVSQGFQFDINEIVTQLPELRRNGTLENIEKNFGVSAAARTHMEKVIDRMENNKSHYRDKAFTKILPVDLNFFTDHYMAPLLENIISKEGHFSESEQEMLKGLGFKTKDIALGKGYISGTKDYYADPLAAMDNDARPPVTQMQNARLYDKDKTASDVTALKKNKIYKDLNATSVYTSDQMDKFMYNNKTSTHSTGSTGLTMKYMQIDSYTLRDQFLNEKNQTKMTNYIDKAFGELSKDDATRAKEVILDRAKRLSTFEQQSNMDARVHDVNFHRSNTQTINSKKKMIANHKDNLDVIKYVEDEAKQKLHFTIGADGKIEYDLGTKVKKGQILGTFGNGKFSQEVTSKWDGMFRGRYFDEIGNVVSEERIQKILQSANIDLNNNEQVLRTLDKHPGLNFKYQVLGMEELHGSKAFLGASEKTTIDSMKLGIGEFNSGLAKELSDIGMDDIIGKVVSKDYLDDVVTKQLNSKVGEKEAKRILKNIFDERYAFSDSVHEIAAFKDVNFITSLDVNKHSSATALMHNALNKLRADGNLTETYLNDMFGEGTYEIIGDKDNAQVKFNEKLTEVNLNHKVGTVLGDALNQDTTVMGVGGNNGVIGHTGIGQFTSVIDDPSGTSSGVFNGEVRGKGVKFSDAMGKNLDRQTYNVDGLGKVFEHYKSIGDMKEFERIYGHALDKESFKNGQLAFNEQYRNKSVAAPITSKLRNQLIKSDHGTLLSEVAGDPNYSHLVNSVREGKLGDISVDKAQLMYSYSRGVEAINMNTNGSAANIERYVNAADHKAFKVMDWSKDNPDWLDLQIGGQGKTVVDSDVNPYTNNMLIKTGLGGDSEYLAIPRMPEIHAGDTLIQKKYTEGLTVLQDKMKQYKNGSVDTTKYITEHIATMKDQLKADITGKSGLIKELTEHRMEQSFMGKGSGIIMAAMDGNKSLFGGSNAGIEDRVRMLDNANANVFKTAMFEGKTLNRHYAEGKVVDSLFMSEDAFRNMGYFDKDFMDKTLGGLDDKFKSQVANMSNEDSMKHLLRTQGDSFISVRYPEIMQGSDKLTMGYLDDNLKSNEMRVLGATGMSAKLDFDGDSVNAARVATTDGLSKLHSATGTSTEELDSMMNGFNSSIATRAVTDNAYWESKVNDFMNGTKGLESMASAMDLETIAKHKLINGKAYIGSIDKSEGELKELYNKYSGTIGQKLKDDSLENAMKDIDGGNLHDYVAAKSYKDRRDMITAKVYKNAIGETNVTNQKIKSEVSGLLDKTDNAYEYKSNLLFDFLYQSEEQAISSKSSVGTLTSDRAQQWNKSASGLFKGTGNRDEHLANMRGWLDDNIKGENVLAPQLYFAKSDAFSNRMGEEFGVHSMSDFSDFMKDKTNASKVENILIDDIMNLMDETSSMKGADKIFETLKVASSQSGADLRTLQNMNFIKDYDSNLKTVYSAFDSVFDEGMASFIEPEMSSTYSNRAFKNSIEEIVNSTAEATAKVSTSDKIGDIIEGAGDFAKSIKGKKLAMGAVGIAASIMVAGYAGGRPRPADVHAMEEAQDYQSMDGSQLADPGMQQGGQQQGYVVNINARTDKGRDNAVQALQQAISNGTSSNINIAMNITDNYGNINNKEINKAIEGAFR